MQMIAYSSAENVRKNSFKKTANNEKESFWSADLLLSVSINNALGLGYGNAFLPFAMTSNKI